MEKITEIKAKGVPLKVSNVDTDQIIPAHWLKNVGRTGFGLGLFEAWRKDDDFVLNNEAYADARVLVAGENFGCGSSREHAPWALQDYGFEAIIAPSFADIFYSNCFKIGLVPVVASQELVNKLWQELEENPDLEITIDIETKTWKTSNGDESTFALDDFLQHRLLNGLDDIGITLVQEDAIDQFEKTRPSWMPKFN